jgi:hypothetical protein
MARTLLLLTILLLSGCGEAERPHFVPASGNSPAASTAERRPGDRSPREVVIPKNIPMH